MTDITEAVLHDGTTISITVRGRGRALLMPTRLEPHAPAEAETMRLWGADPDLGRNLVNGLSASYRVIAADYEGHRMAHPAPDTLTPANVAADLLAVTRAAHAMAAAQSSNAPTADAAIEPGDWDAVTVHSTEAQTRQFVTLYEALQNFDDSTAAVPSNLPRLAFAGSADQIDYAPEWGGVRVRIGEPLAEHEAALIDAGWEVRVLAGLDHLGAMRSARCVTQNHGLARNCWPGKIAAIGRREPVDVDR